MDFDFSKNVIQKTGRSPNADQLMTFIGARLLAKDLRATRFSSKHASSLTSIASTAQASARLNRASLLSLKITDAVAESCEVPADQHSVTDDTVATHLGR